MREAIGGGWIMGIVVMFIFLFAGFLAISINYTKAFKVKNEIINIIEKNEGYTTSGSETAHDETTEGKIRAYMDDISYLTATNIKCPEGLYEATDTNSARKGGYCVKRIAVDEETAYYKVTTFIMIELPIIWDKFTIPVSGETKVIHNDTSGFSNR